MRTGEIAGVVHVTGKPTDLFTKFKPEPGCHFLPVPLPRICWTTTSDQADVDGLSRTDSAGESVETIGVPQVLAVYNWPPRPTGIAASPASWNISSIGSTSSKSHRSIPNGRRSIWPLRFPAGPGFEPQKSCWQSRRKRGSAINQTVHTLALVKTRTIASSSISFAAGKRQIFPGDRLVLDDRFHENDHMGGRHLIPV